MTRTGARRGTTLAELLVAVSLGGLVAGAAVVTSARVRRAAGEQAARADARAQLAHGAAVLGAELRPAATAPGLPEGADLLEASDSAVELRATLGGAPACAVAPGPGGGTALDLAPARDGLAWWADEPRAGDDALVYDPGALPGAADDAWVRRRITLASAGSAVCATGPFAADPGDPPRWRLSLDTPLPVSVGVGAPVRVQRRRRYTLYEASDRQWYFGGREWDGGGWTGVQPIAGPYAAPGEGGMRVILRDSAGAPLPAGAPNARVALAEVTLAARRRTAVGVVRDSLHLVVRGRADGGGP